MKKVSFFFILLSIAILLPNSAFAESFPDVPVSHPNYDAIEYIKQNGIIQGYQDGTYKPDDYINRAEFTKIIIETEYSDEEISVCDPKNSQIPVLFTDVIASDWFYKYICFANRLNVVQGYLGGFFHPEWKINFGEAAKIVNKTFGNWLGYNDIWYKPYVLKLEMENAIPTSIQNVAQFITRGEMAEIVYRLRAGVKDKASLTYAGISFDEHADENIGILPLDETWNEYKNTKRGYSIKIPRKIETQNCEKKTTKIPVETFENSDGVYVSETYYYENSASDNCAQKTTSLSSLQERTVALWKIIVEDVESEAALNDVIAKASEPGCRAGEKKSTAQEGTYDVKIIAKEGAECHSMTTLQFLYSPQKKKVAHWSRGIESIFWNGGKAYDPEMTESFRFE
ncbi:S-layer homology domain-containing protein [Candidatus Peregrinibacteria bacterium]|nr:S-layer homology domain-containing protein [Candidatus Peregrinibacteria bacterium]